jgi:pyruvate dehydrogenase E2 component (dihydrolipoamide acetyltransferase)
MPSLGADMTEGILLEWLVHPGDAVHRGDIVAVVKTDKADVEVEIFDDGVIGELLVPEGDDVLEVATPLATVVDAGATPAPPPATRPAPSVPAPPRQPAPPEPAPSAPRAPVPVPPAPTAADGRVVASPYARRRAAELGVDLAAVTAAQPGHPISAADVERAAASRIGAPATPRTVSPVAPEAQIPVSQTDAMRRAIGRLMARSKREIPHYYLADEIELTGALSWLARRNERAAVEARILPAALLYKAVANAAAARPELNGFWVDDQFVPGTGVHLGVAIALRGGGLVAPALHDADQLSLDELMAALRDLSSRARAGRLRGSEMTDATITVTNLGERGVRSVFGVIYPPQVALVGFGKISDRVWDVDNGLGIRPAVTVTLAADHRASDGHVGATFLSEIAHRLHNPEEL